ncbi:MAG: TlpA family protein disulfide reductase [Bryobacterales bacterium]|nr:TlpA family protein disulfide reductase [Bryobacterales bacterium]
MAFWERKNAKLRPFRLADSKGEVWTSAKVAGKTLIVHLWASYSAPSVMEMPLFSALSERLAGSKDFQILSFNVDEDVSAFKNSIEGKSYPYPVIAAYYYVADIVKFATVPRTWIIGPEGEWQWERSGSDRDAKTFLADLGRRVTLPAEPAAAPAPAPAPELVVASAPAPEPTPAPAGEPTPAPEAAAAESAPEAQVEVQAAVSDETAEGAAEPEAAAPKRARKKKA